MVLCQKVRNIDFILRHEKLSWKRSCRDTQPATLALRPAVKFRVVGENEGPAFGLCDGAGEPGEKPHERQANPTQKGPRPGFEPMTFEATAALSCALMS